MGENGTILGVGSLQGIWTVKEKEFWGEVKNGERLKFLSVVIMQVWKNISV